MSLSAEDLAATDEVRVYNKEDDESDRRELDIIEQDKCDLIQNSCARLVALEQYKNDFFLNFPHLWQHQLSFNSAYGDTSPYTLQNAANPYLHPSSTLPSPLTSSLTGSYNGIAAPSSPLTPSASPLAHGSASLTSPLSHASLSSPLQPNPFALSAFMNPMFLSMQNSAIARFFMPEAHLQRSNAMAAAVSPSCASLSANSSLSSSLYQRPLQDTNNNHMSIKRNDETAEKLLTNHRNGIYDGSVEFTLNARLKLQPQTQPIAPNAQSYSTFALNNMNLQQRFTNSTGSTCSSNGSSVGGPMGSFASSPKMFNFTANQLARHTQMTASSMALPSSSIASSLHGYNTNITNQSNLISTSRASAFNVPQLNNALKFGALSQLANNVLPGGKVSNSLDESISSEEDDDDEMDNCSLQTVEGSMDLTADQSDPPKEHVKKPLNAFMLFMKENRGLVVAESTLKESAAINQKLGKMWRNLSREEQEKYYLKAKKERELHMTLYPNWSAKDSIDRTIRRKKKKKERSLVNRQFKEFTNSGGALKKCRARYGVDQQIHWCKPCKRKKKCSRYMDKSDAS